MEGAAAAAPAAAPSSSTLALANELANAFETLPDVGAPATIPFESHFHALYEHLPETSGKAASRREREENGYQACVFVCVCVCVCPSCRVVRRVDARCAHTS